MTGRRFRDILWVLAFAGLTAATVRFFLGLGQVTALSDSLPWGTWKIVNMVAGVALSTGGFLFAGAVHVFRIHSLERLLRPALVVACLGYGSSCLALFLDIGRPFRIWHPLVEWNIHSFLFEVAWCVMIYFTITLMEVAPIALEKRKPGRLLGILRKISPVVVVIGITLSTLHHTTLGSLFLVSPSRLHPLWYSSMLPLHFILSAAGAGIFSVIFVTFLVTRFYRRQMPDRAIRIAAKAAAVILTAYFVIRVGDLAASGKIGLLFSGQWEATLLWVELLLAVLFPVAVMAIPACRRNRGWIFAASAVAISGLVLNRLDVGIFGYFRSSGASYVPSLAELAVTLGIPAAAGLGFFFFIERFRVFGFLVKPRVAVAGLRHVSLLFVGTVAICGGLFTMSKVEGRPGVDRVAAAVQVEPDAKVLRLDGDGNGVGVTFPHRVHSDWMNGQESCQLCHHLQRPTEEIVSCHECHSSMERTHEIFDHDLHSVRLGRRADGASPLSMNASCDLCHPKGEPRLGATAAACDSCHTGRDWNSVSRHHGVAPAYVEALHGLCGKCHAVDPGGSCQTCHPDGQ